MIITKETTPESITKIDLGAPTTITALKAIKIDLSDIEKDQEAYKLSKKKYCQVKEKDGKSVTEYLCPDGSVGYHITLTKEVDGKKYCKMIGYGPEAESRTHDWYELTEDFVEEVITKPLLEVIKK